MSNDALPEATDLKSLTQIRRQARARRGFTFLEIMFVVVIIGVLLAIAVPKLTGRGEKARRSATEATMRAVGVALSEYELHIGRFPNTSEGLGALVEMPSGLDEERWQGPYMEEIPKDAWGKELNYRSPGDKRKEYDLWSNGGDGQEGSEDDVVNWKK